MLVDKCRSVTPSINNVLSIREAWGVMIGLVWPMSRMCRYPNTAALQRRGSRLISSMPYTVSVTVPLRLAAQPHGGLRTPLELPQMLPQRGPGVLCTCHAALLEQGDDLLH